MAAWLKFAELHLKKAQDCWNRRDQTAHTAVSTMMSGPWAPLYTITCVPQLKLRPVSRTGIRAQEQICNRTAEGGENGAAVQSSESCAWTNAAKLNELKQRSLSTVMTETENITAEGSSLSCSITGWTAAPRFNMEVYGDWLTAASAGCQTNCSFQSLSLDTLMP